MIHGKSATYMGTQQIIVKSLGKKLSDSYRIGKKGVVVMPITTGNRTKTLFNFAVVCLFMFGFRYLPPIGSITPWGMQTIGIFIGVLYGWTVDSKIWPSLLGIVALGYLPDRTVFQTLGISFTDNLVLTTLFMFCFSAIVEEVGLSKYVANWCISRKFATGKPYIMLAMFCLAAWLVSSFVNLFASMLLLTIIFGKFCSQAGFKTGDKYPAYGAVAIVLACTVGGGIFPFMGQSYVVNTVMEKTTGATMNFVMFTLIQIVFSIVTMGTFLALLKFVVKPDVSLLLRDDDRFACYRDDKMTGAQKQAVGLIALLMVLLFLPGILPVSWGITIWLKNLSVPGAAVLTLAVYYIINLGKEDVVPFPKLAAGINWDLIMMFATIAPLVAAVNAAESNIMPFVVEQLNGILDGMGPITFIVVFLFISMVVSQFVNNVAGVLAVMPGLFAVGQSLGISPLVIAILASYILNISFCTPTASGNAAYLFSFKEWISSGQAFKAGLVIQIIAMLFTALGAPIIMALF